MSAVGSVSVRAPARALARALALGTLLAALATSPRAASASPDDDFRQAVASFRAGEYPMVINLITGILYPEPTLEGERKQIDAHVLLGVSYFETGNMRAAATQFTTALEKGRAQSLVVTVEPPAFSKSASEFFAERKTEYERQSRTEEEAAKARAEGARLRLILDNLLIEERHDFYINFIPFGAGQFQNGHRKKGIFFLSSGIVLTGASLGLYTYQLLRYTNDKVPKDEVDTAKTVQVLQVTSGALALGLAIGGILDAWYFYRPTVKRQPPAELRKQYEELLKDPPKKTETTFRILPTVGPETVGAAVFLEF